MDKFEYKVRAQEIKSLIAQGEYAQAAEIADTIDWRRVKSVMMLCTISDLYKINRRYEDARDMLLLAYDRHPGGRTIVYSLCELSIKMEEFVQAVEYYKEFVQIAPKDTGRYILQYKLYEAQDVSLEERIAVLEELKKRDYREKWAYELAYLYHRVGLSARCVEECDELILWFGDGKYVIKAMELKMLHQPLTPNQQQRYDHRFQPHYEDVVPESEENGQELYEEPVYADETAQNGSVYPQEPSYEDAAWNQETKGQQEEFDIQVKTMDVSQYNTINLQKELAEGLKEVLREQEPVIADPVIRDIMAPMMEPETELSDFSQTQEDLEEVEEMEPQETEVFFGETGEIGDVEPVAEIMQNTEYQEEISQEEDREVTGQLDPEDIVREWERIKQEYGDSKQKVFEPEAEADMEPEIEPEAEADMEPEIEPEAEPDEAEELVKIEETEDSQEEAAKEPAKEIPAEEKSAVPVREKVNIRNLTKEEKELFGAFIQNRATRNKLITALDQISLAAYTGNVIITGYEGMDTLNLAKNMIRDIQMMDSNLSGKTAKISAAALNQKDVEMILEQLKNGALIVQKASDMNEKTADAMYKKLQQESLGIIVILEDTKKKMDKFLSRNKRLAECFNARLDVEALSNEALVAFGKKYAREMEYSIDELGVLALHTRIEEMQSIDHAVTIMEVRGIMEDAIHHANRKTVKHFLDVLLGKRYDEEDMIILRENDFV